MKVSKLPLLISLLLALGTTEVAAQRADLFLRQQPAANAVRLSSPENARAQITIASVSGAFITRGKADSLQVAWVDQQRRCRLYYASRPGGSDPAKYPNSVPTIGRGNLLVTGVFRDLPLGIYYCILRDVDDPAATSVEFLVFVQPQTPVRMLSPIGALDLDREQPLLRWQAIEGIPYYFVVVSQGKLDIQTNSRTGEIEKVIGINIIWQAFSAEPSIRYGATDLSGTWPDGNTPPLLPGETYSWIVFGAFAPDLRFVTWNLFPLFASEFQVQRTRLSQAPGIRLPAPQGNIGGENIRFSWSQATGARRYRILLQEVFKDEDLGEGTIALWQYITVDTTAQFRAREFLAGAQQKVSVMAETPGRISVSPPRTFTYASPRGVIRVQTRDRATGAVIPFAEFELRRPLDTGFPFSFVTGQSGSFVLEVPTGDYIVDGRNRGFLPQQMSGTVRTGDTTTVRIDLEPAPRLINGRVLGSGGRPVPFAEIAASGQSFSEKADGLGHFSFSVRQSPSRLLISAPGYRSATLTSFPFNALGVADVGEIVLEPASAMISGRLRDAGGMPLSGVRFQLDGAARSWQFTNGSSENFSFALEAGAWEVRARYEGYYSIPESYAITLAPGENRQLSFLFFNAALLEGHTFSGNDLLGEVDLTLTNKAGGAVYEARSNNFGAYRFDVPAGEYVLRATKAGFAAYEAEVTLVEGKTTPLDVVLQKGSVIWGLVSAGFSGEPLADVEIFESDGGATLARTGTDGIYGFAAEPGRTYRLDARRAGYVSTSERQVRAEDGDSTRADFTMTPASALVSGTVTSSGAPVAQASVRIRETGVSARTDRDGKYTISVLPGDYTLDVSGECFNPAAKTVSVAPGETAVVDFELEGSAATVSGTVFDASGAPVAGASILAAGEQTYTARSDSAGSYRICLDPGTYFVLVSRIGYATRDLTIIVRANENREGLDFFLEENFATISGRTESLTGMAVPDAQVILSSPWQQVVTRSSAAGVFSFERVIPGEIILFTRAETFFADPETLSVRGREQKQAIIRMFRSDGEISGRIVDGFTEQGIEGALLTAQLQGSTRFFTAFSEAPDGAYRLANLPVIPGRNFQVSVRKEGYVLARPAEAVQGNRRNLDFQLFATNASITGTVRSADSKAAIAGATVRISRPGDPVLQAQTAADGSFTVPGVAFTFEYTLAVEHPRFFAAAQKIQAPAAGVVVELQRRLAFAAGAVTHAGSSQGFANADVIFANIDGVGRSDTARTDAGGRFSKALWPATYQVYAEAPLFFSTPQQRLLTLAPEDSASALTFSLEPQVLKTISIQGPVEIVNNAGSAQFSVVASDTGGRSIGRLPGLQWFVNTSGDTARIDAEGRLALHPGFSGDLTLRAQAANTPIGDSLRVSVLAVASGTGEREYFSRQGQRLLLLPGALPENTTFKLTTAPILPVQNVESAFRVVGRVFRLVPDNLEFTAPALLSVAVPSALAGSQMTLLRWDNLASIWEQPATVQTQAAGSGRVARQVSRAGDYALVEFSQPLSIQSLHIRPNPFSPLQINEFGQSGTAIIFAISTDKTALPKVTARIYNLEGNLVATLAEQQPFGKGEKHLSWSGRTSDGLQARNGRYLLRFEVDDGTDRLEVLKSIVVVR